MAFFLCIVYILLSMVSTDVECRELETESSSECSSESSSFWETLKSAFGGLWSDMKSFMKEKMARAMAIMGVSPETLRSVKQEVRDWIDGLKNVDDSKKVDLKEFVERYTLEEMKEEES